MTAASKKRSSGRRTSAHAGAGADGRGVDLNPDEGSVRAKGTAPAHGASKAADDASDQNFDQAPDQTTPQTGVLEKPAKIRVDKWLWQARFVKSRSLAAGMVTAGHVRINGDRAAKPATPVTPGDVLTFQLGDHVRVVRIVAPGARRGPAPEAQGLYQDLTPPAAPDRDNNPTIRRAEGNARPTKRDRRKLDLDRRRALE